MSEKRKVLITGASGYVASQMLPEFRERYDLTLLDVTKHNRDGNEVDGIIVADLTDPDRSGYERLFDGVDAVVHLGYVRSEPGGVFGAETPQIDRFDVELRNVRMANNVYRAAYDAGVRRIVSASSNHAADWYEDYQVHTRQLDLVRPEDFPVSSNFYGWAKASYELLGWPYACGTFGRRMEFVMVRIGHPTPVNAGRHAAEQPGSPPAGSGIANFKRNLACYFSPRDLRQLFRKAIEKPGIGYGATGVPFAVVYGISDNTRAFWSLETARRILGYEPEDDSEVIYAAEISRYVTGGGEASSTGPVGG